MASIEKREGKNGVTWRAVIKRIGHANESRSFDRAGDAHAWAAEREHQLTGQGSARIVAGKTVNDAIVRYIAEELPKQRAAVTIEKVLRHFQRTLPFIGKRIAEVQPADVANWRDHMKRSQVPQGFGGSRRNNTKPLSAGSRARYYGCLRTVFHKAMREWSWLRVSPFEQCEPPAPGKARTQRWIDTDIAKMLLALGYRRGARPGNHAQFAAVAFLLALKPPCGKAKS
jgi:hypothetical protein